MFCAPLQGFGYAGGDLELLVGLAPEKGPSCWQSWVTCSAASISTKCQGDGGSYSSEVLVLKLAQRMAVFAVLASLAL